MIGKTLTEDYDFKKCCNICGFPVELERKPVFITNNILSLTEYRVNTCDSCGHQQDGTTIPVVHAHWTKLCNKFLKERDDLIRFLKYYTTLTIEERKGVCVELPRFMKPEYKSSGDIAEDDVLEPYSWNIVYNEILGNTSLSRVTVRDIDWNKVVKT